MWSIFCLISSILPSCFSLSMSDTMIATNRLTITRLKFNTKCHILFTNCKNTKSRFYGINLIHNERVQYWILVKAYLPIIARNTSNTKLKRRAYMFSNRPSNMSLNSYSPGAMMSVWNIHKWYHAMFCLYLYHRFINSENAALFRFLSVSNLPLQ